MTLREFENTGKLGCISCFNAFGNEINNRMLRLYGSEEYMGRQPGETIAYEYDDGVKTETSVPAETVPDRKEEKSKDMVDRIKKADFGTLSDEQLQEAMKKAVEKEDFALAARLRDELNSRKGEGDNE